MKLKRTRERARSGTISIVSRNLLDECLHIRTADKTVGVGGMRCHHPLSDQLFHDHNAYIQQSTRVADRNKETCVLDVIR